MQPRDNFGQHADGIDRRTAIHARMQVAAGRLDHHFIQHQTAQHGGDSRRMTIPHIGVAHHHQIRSQLALIFRDKGGERGRAGFLLTFKQNRHIAGQSAILMKGAAGLDKGHQLALIIGRTAPDNLLAGGQVCQRRLEGGRGPQFQRVCGLHVIMAIKEHMRHVAPLGLGMGEHHGPARRRAHGGGEADAIQLIHQPLRRFVTFARIGRVGRYGGNTHQLEQTCQRIGLIGINSGQNMINLRHQKAPPLLNRN